MYLSLALYNYYDNIESIAYTLHGRLVVRQSPQE